jgi:hypothetical protein
VCKGKIVCLTCAKRYFNPLSRADNAGAAPSFALNPYGYYNQNSEVELPHSAGRSGTSNVVPQALQAAQGHSYINAIWQRGFHRVFPVATGYESTEVLITGQKPTIARRRIYIPVPQYHLDAIDDGSS